MGAAAVFGIGIHLRDVTFGNVLAGCVFNHYMEQLSDDIAMLGVPLGNRFTV